MLMMRLDRTDKLHWTSLHDDLVRFGRASGLFSNIKVKRHGRQMSDPFQLQVKVRTGPNANIMDVGYGISQSLPILVDLMHEEQSVFLLQQPEVHLHPRGQAELASPVHRVLQEARKSISGRDPQRLHRLDMETTGRNTARTTRVRRPITDRAVSAAALTAAPSFLGLAGRNRERATSSGVAPA